MIPEQRLARSLARACAEKSLVIAVLRQHLLQDACAAAANDADLDALVMELESAKTAVRKCAQVVLEIGGIPPLDVGVRGGEGDEQ
jgi:hypothetical protein